MDEPSTPVSATLLHASRGCQPVRPAFVIPGWVRTPSSLPPFRSYCAPHPTPTGVSLVAVVQGVCHLRTDVALGTLRQLRLVSEGAVGSRSQSLRRSPLDAPGAPSALGPPWTGLGRGGTSLETKRLEAPREPGLARWGFSGAGPGVARGTAATSHRELPWPGVDGSLPTLAGAPASGGETGVAMDAGAIGRGLIPRTGPAQPQPGPTLGRACRLTRAAPARRRRGLRPVPSLSHWLVFRFSGLSVRCGERWSFEAGTPSAGGRPRSSDR